MFPIITHQTNLPDVFRKTRLHKLNQSSAIESLNDIYSGSCEYSPQQNQYANDAKFINRRITKDRRKKQISVEHDRRKSNRRGANRNRKPVYDLKSNKTGVEHNKYPVSYPKIDVEV